jgi:phenylalanine ammonia-lyase
MDYHGGNFFGQYIGVAMDQLRYYLGLIAKHLDAQIAMLVAPEFSNGLPPCLIGNTDRAVNMGLKGLQITGNSIMPLLSFYGQSIADRFPTHAEQFNQNINSLGMGSACLACLSIEAFQQYLAIALIFGIQAVDLRTKLIAGHYDARICLSPATTALYESVREVVGCPPSAERPYIRNDDEQALDDHIRRIANDIAGQAPNPSLTAPRKYLSATVPYRSKKIGVALMKWTPPTHKRRHNAPSLANGSAGKLSGGVRDEYYSECNRFGYCEERLCCRGPR